MNQQRFVNLCKIGDLVELKKLDYTEIDIHYKGEWGFRIACEYGYLDVAKYLIWLGEYHNQKINIHIFDESAMRLACDSGHLHIAQYLIWLGEENNYGKVDIHIWNESIMRITCASGHLNVAKYLIWLGENGYSQINIHDCDEFAFYSALKGEHFDVANYLIHLGKNGYGLINIHHNFDLLFSYGSFQIRQYLVKQDPDYDWHDLVGYASYIQDINLIAARLSLLHQYLVEYKSDIKEMMVLKIVKEYLI